MNTAASLSRLCLRVSRFNSRRPRGQTHPEIRQRTADVQHQITDTLLPQATPVFADATALDTAVDMRQPQPAGGEAPEGGPSALA